MPAESPENVLFVVMDTVKKDHLSPYGYDRPTTPTLNSFAEDATVFEEAVAPAPWTLPVHASLFTGLYPSQHGASQENPYLEGATTIAQTLSAAGYRTACYSSNAWITPYTHLTDGFDDQDNFFEVMPGEFLTGPLARAWKMMNDNESLRALADKLVSLGNTAHEYFAGGEGADSKTPAVIDRTIEFIDNTEDEFFTFINLMDAHLPYHPPPAFREEFAPDVDSSAVCQNSKEYNAGARSIDDEEWADIQALYDAEIAHIDDQLGRLFNWLQQAGLWDETMVVVCADHGELHGEHDIYGHEFCLYDQLVNVPLLIKHPELDTERRHDQVELIDLYHTVLDALDVDGGNPNTPGETAVAHDQTRSLLSDSYREFESLAGTDESDPAQQSSDGSYAFIEYSRPVVELKQLEEKAASAGVTLSEDSRFYSRMRAARRTDAKYVRIDRISDEAYQLDTDPDEQNSVAGVVNGNTAGMNIEAEAITATETALAAFESAVGGAWTDGIADDVTDDTIAEMDADAQERLRDLGYLE
jgi:Arylsulfatase A and related enzymes